MVRILAEVALEQPTSIGLSAIYVRRLRGLHLVANE